jgi:hypothetical protein
MAWSKNVWERGSSFVFYETKKEETAKNIVFSSSSSLYNTVLKHCVIHYTHHHIRYTLVITISQKKQFPRRRQVSLICATIYLPLSTKSQLASTVMKKGPVIPGLYVTGMIVYTSSFGSTSRKNPSGVEISWIGTKPVIVQGTFWW